MIGVALVWISTLAALPPLMASPRQNAPARAETVVDVRVHGNQVATDAEVIALAGVTTGDRFTAATIDDVTKRLEASGKFDHVTVLKRFASIEDPSRILVMIVVDEGPVRVQLGEKPGDPVTIVKRGFLRDFMYLPILDWEDGYGGTFGVTVSKVNVTAPRGRVSAPLSIGGTKQAGLVFDRPMTSGPFTLVEVGGNVQQQTNPAFTLDDTRRRVWGRVERGMGPWRVGATGMWQHVSFAGADDDLRSASADVTLDTRVDPVLPRNAVFATASVEHISFASGGGTNRVTAEGRGYVGLIGQTTLAIRGLAANADHALAPYLQPMLGGWDSVRGYEAGAFVGDTLLAGSLEFRVPLTSALHVAKIGVSVFVDSGTVYAKGESLSTATWHTGTGGGVWVAATILQFGVSVAHANGGGFRVNVGGGLTF
jgi:outer membrane protein assembly factor BamA